MSEQAENEVYRLKTYGFHGEEVPCTPFGLDKFPTGQVVWKNLKVRMDSLIKTLEFVSRW